MPRLPQHHLLVRDPFANRTAVALMKMNLSQGRLLVHGIPGSGKAMAVANSIRYIVKEKDHFYPSGAYWIKIGNFQKNF